MTADRSARTKAVGEIAAPGHRAACWNGHVVETLLETLRSDQRLAEWLSELEADDSPRIEVQWPDAQELPTVLLDLAIPHEDINELIGLRARMTGDAEVRWLLERTVQSLATHIGTLNHWPRIPTMPESWGAVGRWFYVYVYLGLLPHTAEYHRSRGIPEDVSRRTLADIGRNAAVYRRRHGVGGMNAAWWPLLHLRGELYQLGRLQFQRNTLGNRTGGSVAAAGLPFGPGSPTLSLHIPDFFGPLDPRDCDRSLELAREFFPRYFPREPYMIASCHSWLLDPQLRAYLPQDSNIVRFQQRFTLAYSSPEKADRDVIGFVFGDDALPVDRLPQRSTLERAVVEHLRSGGHWHLGHGWFEM
jgi:hypothetical protein